jgi:hypothetical protein
MVPRGGRSSINPGMLEETAAAAVCLTAHRPVRTSGPRLARRGAVYGRFRHAIPTHIRPQVRDLALRGLVALMVAVELTALLWWRRADDDHQNEGGGINHGDLFSWPARPLGVLARVRAMRGNLKECLVPKLKRGDVVMMDSLLVHRVAAVREVIEAAGAKLRYLPKYSPDLNPIEQGLQQTQGTSESCR